MKCLVGLLVLTTLLWGGSFLWSNHIAAVITNYSFCYAYIDPTSAHSDITFVDSDNIGHIYVGATYSWKRNGNDYSSRKPMGVLIASESLLASSTYRLAARAFDDVIQMTNFYYNTYNGSCVGEYSYPSMCTIDAREPQICQNYDDHLSSLNVTSRNLTNLQIGMGAFLATVWLGFISYCLCNLRSKCKQGENQAQEALLTDRRMLDGGQYTQQRVICSGPVPDNVVTVTEQQER